MEAVIGLFLIVMLFALLTGNNGDRVEGGRPLGRSDGGSGSGSRITTVGSDNGSSNILPAMILLLTIVALMFNAG